MHLSDLPTPQVLIDSHRLFANIERAQQLADSAGLKLRPHAKTHKSPIVAKWQIERGAVGVCCAKVGEAEVFVAAGIDNIRLPYPVNPSNASRLFPLMDRASISIIVDHLAVASGWSEAMQRAGRVLDVMIKVDVGFHRCGIDPEERSALDFVRAVSSMNGLRLRGLLSHAGHGYHATSEDQLCAIAAREAEILTGLRDRARAAGIDVGELSVGATPTLRFSVRQRGLTELRPGNYVYFDRTQVALGAASLTDCALTVLTTVVEGWFIDYKSTAPKIIDLARHLTAFANRMIAGRMPSGGDGRDRYAINRADVAVNCAACHIPVQTTGVSPSKNGGRHLSNVWAPISSDLLLHEPGARVRVVPNHSCVVSNLVDVVRLVEDDRVVDNLPVAARGKIQ